MKSISRVQLAFGAIAAPLASLLFVSCTQTPTSGQTTASSLSRPSAKATASGKIVLGYIDGQYAQSQTNANTYHSSMSDLSISSYYWITNTGTIPAASGAITPSTLISQAHTNGLRVYPGISNNNGDWNNSYAYGAAVTNKSAAVTNIVNFVKNNNFDGAEIDFEYASTSGAPSAAQFTSFLSALATSLHAANANYKLIASVPPHNNWMAAQYDYAGIAAAVDYMQIMTYDETGPGFGTTGYNSGYAPGPVAGNDWMGDELNYQINTLHISPSKILSGLPAYGQDYSTGSQVYWVNYASTLSKHSGYTAHRGLAGDTVTPWASWGTVNYAVDNSATQPCLWYDDATSIQAKAALVNTYNVAGTSVWAIGYEDANFWTAVNAGLGGSSQTVAVSISPTTASLTTGGTQQFTASVTGSTNTSVTWTCTGGTVSTSGLYTAPTTAGTYTVKATSVADTSKSASATVTVSATQTVAVSISPTSVSLSTSGTQQFTATVTGSTNTSVTWTATGGTVSTSGLYTAPTTAGTYTVKATSVADTTKSASATVTVTASGSDTNIAPSGTGYVWAKNSTAFLNTNKTAKTGVNDNNLTTDVVVNSSGEGGSAKWEAAGVTFTAAKTISSVKFINGTVTSGGDGYFQSGCSLQFSTDGTTWVDSGWTLSPAYPNSNAASGVTYTFTGTAKSGVKGVRVAGQTGASSWYWIVKEVQVIGH